MLVLRHSTDLFAFSIYCVLCSMEVINVKEFCIAYEYTDIPSFLPACLFVNYANSPLTSLHPHSDMVLLYSVQCTYAVQLILSHIVTVQSTVVQYIQSLLESGPAPFKLTGLLPSHHIQAAPRGLLLLLFSICRYLLVFLAWDSHLNRLLMFLWLIRRKIL